MNYNSTHPNKMRHPGGVPGRFREAFDTEPRPNEIVKNPPAGGTGRPPPP
jgi:hypothetical protein